MLGPGCPGGQALRPRCTLAGEAGPCSPRRAGHLCPQLLLRMGRAWPYSHEHCTADQKEEIKAVAISKERVPDPDDIRQQELLGQQ